MTHGGAIAQVVEIVYFNEKIQVTVVAHFRFSRMITSFVSISDTPIEMPAQPDGHRYSRSILSKIETISY